ncbi:MAG TPA: hypothetical protein VK622_06000 [Puia sp.]|nr:hypothetical protein [Puia sp.]
MQASHFIKAGLLAIAVSIIAAATWEIYLRHVGVDTSYDDNKALWAYTRAKAYGPKDRTTVFIGSSRIKYDLDIPTWQQMTGDHAIQLACVGSSPAPVLRDLANDSNFRGKLVVDVTEEIFLSPSSFNDEGPSKRVEYFHKISPTQRASFQVDRVLESMFVFLDQDNYSFNAMLPLLYLPQRAGVFPDVIFPPEFDRTALTRQSRMTSHFLADTSLQNRVKGIWDFFIKTTMEPPATGKKLDSVIQLIKTDVDKIQSRGGEVIFVRTPSSGKVLQYELRDFPRADYWEKLLAATGCKGIYYKDYPAIAQFECPESSHLSPEQAVVFTKSLVKILEEEKGWTFNN